MYFKLFKLTNWRKITGEGRRHNCAVLPFVKLQFSDQNAGQMQRFFPQEVAGQCWRNSKYDPPTEADADRLGRIIVWGAAAKHVDITYWENAIFHPVDVPFWMPLPVAPEEKAE